MRLFQTTVMLRPTELDGNQVESHGPWTVINVYSLHNAGDLNRLRVFAESRGFGFEGNVCELPLTPSSTESAAFEMSRVMDEIAGMVGAVGRVDDARLNALERQARNTERMMTRMLGALERITERIDGPKYAERAPGPDYSIRAPAPPAPLPPVPPLSPQTYPQPVDSAPLTAMNPQLEPKQQAAASLGLPLIGTHPGFTGDLSSPVNPNARGGGRTGEMATGQIAVSGKAPTSQIFSISGVDDRGEGVAVVHEIPKVGNTLTPPASASDIPIG
jgi:hypothetical protein